MKLVKLKDISIGQGNYGIGAAAVDYNNNLYKYLRITDIKEDGTVDENELKSVADINAKNYLLKENDICFARTGNSTGKTYFYDGTIKDLVYAGFLIKFSLDNKKVNPKYIKFYTLSNKYKNWVKEVQTGSTRGNINAKMYGELEIELPKREYQDKAVKLLETITKRIELNKHTNNNLLQLGDLIYNNFFISPKDEWHIKTLKEISNNFDSKRKPMSSREREEHKGTYPYYGATSIIDYVDNYLFDDTYILMGEDGTVITDDNKPVLQYIWGKFWANNHAHVLQGSIISNEYLYFALRNTDVKSLVTGAVQPKINQENMNKLKFIIPDQDNLRILEKSLSILMKKYKENCCKISTLEQIRDTLLPKLMNGEIDLDKIEI